MMILQFKEGYEWSIITVILTANYLKSIVGVSAPYCSVASLYLWAVAGGAIPEMKDYKPKTTKKEKK